LFYDAHDVENGLMQEVDKKLVFAADVRNDSKSIQFK
jgi:hypothetical protein